MSDIMGLSTLTNIIQDIVPAPEFSETDVEELRESIYLVIEDFVSNNSIDYMYEDFEAKVFEHTRMIMEILHSQIVDIIKSINLVELIQEGIITYFNLIGKPRSYPNSRVFEMDKPSAIKQIQKLRSLSQTVQNTPEWFEFRRNRLTASSAWKALGSDAKRNELIYSKCQPLNKTKYTSVNVNSATHHGHKYEPLSTIFYEHLYNTKIEEFGCIPDPYNKEFGASPDGINVKRDNERFGYLLEIKNPVSRKITGTPKKEYWVQMQFQMHVTRLHVCDFLETSFKEYPSESESKSDGEFNKTASGNPKGVIVCFHDGCGPAYEYSPWNCSEDEFNEWYDKLLDKSSDKTWIKNIYWRLDNYSCVTVQYIKKWFDVAKPIFEEIWRTIEKERIAGYSHRKPKQRKRKPPIISPLISHAVTPLHNIPILEIEPPKLTLKIRTEALK